MEQEQQETTQETTLQVTPVEQKILNYDEDTRVIKTVKKIRRFGIELEILVPQRGRPLVVDEDVIEKLCEGWLMGFEDEEACVWAGISPKTLYNFQKGREEFLQLKEDLKKNPIIKARMTLFKALDDPVYAWKYLQKKVPDLQDDLRPNVQLNVQLNQLVEEDRKRID